VPQTLDAALSKASGVGERRQRPGDLPHTEDEADDRGVRDSSIENQDDATPAPEIPGFLRRHKAWVIIAALASDALGGTLWWLNAR
jgi:hypothetical protein